MAAREKNLWLLFIGDVKNNFGVIFRFKMGHFFIIKHVFGSLFAQVLQHVKFLKQKPPPYSFIVR